MKAAIADTGFLVALASSNDSYHQWARGISKKIEEPLLTCEAVLCETAYLLKNTSVALGFLKTGLVQCDFLLSYHLSELERLAERYQDRKPDLADLCLIRMSELHPKHSVITIDVKDFNIYRRNRRELIPIIHPPIL